MAHGAPLSCRHMHFVCVFLDEKIFLLAAAVPFFVGFRLVFVSLLRAHAYAYRNTRKLEAPAEILKRRRARVLMASNTLSLAAQNNIHPARAPQHMHFGWMCVCTRAHATAGAGINF
jgi:hypothetical protein